MSYIQVELDAFNSFPLVARAAGLSVEHVTHGLLSLWAHCYRTKVDRVRLVELRGFFGPGEGLVDALEAFGFVELVDGGVRVRGVSRYTRLNDARRDAGRKGGQTSAAKRGDSERGSNGRFAPKQTEAPPKQVLRSAPKQTGSTVDGTESPKQVLRSSTEATEAPPKQVLKQTAPAPKQNQALYPRSESSSPYGEEELSEGSAVERGPKPAPPPVGGPAGRAGGRQETEAERHRRWRHGEITVADLPGWTDEGYGLKPPHPRAPWPFPEHPFDWGKGPDGSLIRTLKDRDDPRHALQTQYWREQGWL